MSRALGPYGEKVACEYLKDKGFSILEKNLRNNAGEVDIVAKKLDTLYFIEVKTREDVRFGFPEQYVDKRKLERIKRAALLYKQQNQKSTPDLMAILVIGILITDNDNLMIRLIKVED